MATSTSSGAAHRGTAALLRLWDRLDLPPDEPQVLSDRGSLMVRMPAAGVVARVSSHTSLGRPDPGRWFDLEVTVGRLAHAAGAPVVPPSEHPPAGPHEVDGVWISLWIDVGDGADRRADPVETATALAAWHDALVDAGEDLPVLTVAHEVITGPLEHARRHGFLDEREHAALRREHEEALVGIEGLGTTSVLLHGDAHRGNLLRDRTGRWLWADLEEACRGPVEWDLAVLGSTPTPEIGAQALTAYARITGRRVPDADELTRWRRLRDLEGNAWAIGCAVSFPERYAAPARAYVDRVLGGRVG